MRPKHLKTASELAAGKPHGIRIKYLGGCRCADCRRANTTYELRRAVHRATGRGNHLVPAGRARKHLRYLSRHGVGRRRVARLTKIGETILSWIKSGRRKQIRANTERRILNVSSNAAPLVPARSTWELINRLIEEGFTKGQIALRLGYKTAAIQLNRKYVTVENARRVKALYDEIELGADYVLDAAGGQTP